MYNRFKTYYILFPYVITMRPFQSLNVYLYYMCATFV